MSRPQRRLTTRATPWYETRLLTPNPKEAVNESKFREEIREAINRNSAENGSNTPDFILAEYLTDCLATFDRTSRAREKWYGKALTVGGGHLAVPAPAPMETK